MDGIIRSFVKNDRHGKEEVTHDETSNVCSNNIEEKDEDNDNENDLSKNEESSCVSDNDEYDHDDYDCDSYSDDEHSECLNEDSEIEYFNSDDSIKSNMERWLNNRPRYRCETYSE